MSNETKEWAMKRFTDPPISNTRYPIHREGGKLDANKQREAVKGEKVCWEITKKGGRYLDPPINGVKLVRTSVNFPLSFSSSAQPPEEFNFWNLELHSKANFAVCDKCDKKAGSGSEDRSRLMCTGEVCHYFFLDTASLRGSGPCHPWARECDRVSDRVNHGTDANHRI